MADGSPNTCLGSRHPRDSELDTWQVYSLLEGAYNIAHLRGTVPLSFPVGAVFVVIDTFPCADSGNMIGGGGMRHYVVVVGEQMGVGHAVLSC